MTANDYRMRVEYSPADRGYLATVREFPDMYYVSVSKPAAAEGLLMKLNSALLRGRENDLGSPVPVQRSHAYVW